MRQMGIRERLALWGYLAAMNLFLPPAILIGLPLLLLKEKRRKTVFKRLGFQTLPTARGSVGPLWVHALSLGEMLSSASLMSELRRQVQDRPIWFSVSTLSAMQLAEERLHPFVDGFFYFPLDLWWPARRALRRVNPALIVFIETDIWPGIQAQLRSSGRPAVLVNGRLSPGSYRACGRFRSLFVPALNTFRKIHPQSTAEAQRYAEVGVQPERLGVCGNLKFDVADATPPASELDTLRNRLGLGAGEVVLLAGSTHPGEEEAVLAAFAAVREQVKDAKLIIVPRHPARGAEVVTLAESRQARVRRFTSGPASAPWEVMVVDAMGVLSKLYHLATVAFVGGSLVFKGGQNPLEPAAAGCPVVFGSDMSDFPDIARWLIESGAAVRVDTAHQLGEVWLKILLDAERRASMASAGHHVVESNRGATQKIVSEILGMLREIDGVK